MVLVHPEYVVDGQKHTKAVILSISEWEKVINELEQLDDIRAYDEAKQASQERVRFDQAVREIQEEYDS